MSEVYRKDIPVVAPEFQVENKTGITRTKREGTVVREVAVATYDVTGGDSGTIAAHGLGVFIPTKAIITKAWVDVVTTFTSATDATTIALKVQGTGDLTAAIAISDSSNVWDAGIHGCLPGSYAEATVAGDSAILDAARNAASFIKTTAVREITATVAVEALTAGKLNVYLEYVLSD
ncbi:MAG: hypothetical protein BGO51_15560 [Rhodospirillales bacterium 69-11]|nr:MAG: hypothetical protein BGO51_15560 [Rhodospirillales bacterium 69-11]